MASAMEYDRDHQNQTPTDCHSMVMSIALSADFQRKLEIRTFYLYVLNLKMFTQLLLEGKYHVGQN